MAKEKIDQVLEKIELLEKGQHKLEEEVQKNSDLIRENGVMIEKVDSDLKGVAAGHITIRSEMRQMEDRLSEKISFVDGKVEFLGVEVRGIKTEFKETKEEFKGLKEEVNGIKQDVKEVKQKVDKIDRTLDEHVRQPAHTAS